MSKLKKISIPALLLFFLVVNLVSLDSIPPEVSNDEAANGYEAFSLISIGRDQWGAKRPLRELRGFGDYRLPVYVYLTIPAVAVFGLNSDCFVGRLRG